MTLITLRPQVLPARHRKVVRLSGGSSSRNLRVDLRPPMANLYPTTNWAALISPEEADQAVREAALDYLAETYWEPVYATVRRRGNDVETSRDLTQAFFLRLLDGRLLQQVDPEKGRFRAFLSVALRNFLINQHEHRSTQSRSPGTPLLSLDVNGAEERSRIDPVDELTPEQVFERRWAQSLIRRSLARLGEEQQRMGRAERYELLRDHIAGERGIAYAEIAERLDTSEGAIKTAVSRLRKRFGELLRAEVANTVTDQTEVDGEIRHLLEIAVL